MQVPSIEFYYDFASTYSYLSAMRIEQLATAAGVLVAWKPFLLGPIFQAQGWTTSPFNLYPAKGRYMVRDLQRICSDRNLRFRLPDPFPQNGLHAARIALVAAEGGWIAPFTRAVYLAEFADGANIGEPASLAPLIERIEAHPRLDFARISARSASQEIKDRLKANTAEAQRVGIFGAPTFRTADAELFWGDDRLEHAVAWAKRL